MLKWIPIGAAEKHIPEVNLEEPLEKHTLPHYDGGS